MNDAYELRVPAEVRVCPACGAHLWTGGEIAIPGSPDLNEIATAVQAEIALRTEQTIIDHYVSQHPLRYRLWMRLRWKWLLG